MPPTAKTVTAAVETLPVESRDDAADDPAIWIDRADPAHSRIFGTDKQAGLGAYDLGGRLLEFLPLGELNNVDIRQGVELGGRARDIAAATNRTDATITLIEIDRSSGAATRLDAFASGWAEPYGACMGMTADQTPIVFANNKDGAVRKWSLRETAAGGVTAELLGEAQLRSQLEGCVYDDEALALYVGEEDHGFWRIDWPGNAPGEPVLIDEVGSGTGLTDDVEGLAIYRGGAGRNYLIASSQGSHSYIVYELGGEHRLVGEFAVIDDPASGIDGSAETDGIEATSVSLGAEFPRGIFVAQDGFNDPEGLQNFKIVDWREIEAALGLDVL